LRNAMEKYTTLVREKVRLLKASSLHANSMYIMIAQGLIAVFGFVFWLIVARLFNSSEVGLAGSLISVATLITNISMLGFNNALVRFLPKSTDKNGIVNTSLLVVIGASLVSALIYLIGLKFFSPKMLFVTHDPVLLVMFLLSMVLVAINTLTDSVFLAYRATKYNVVIYLAYSLLRVASPVALSSFGVMGIFAAHMSGIVAAVFLSLYFMRKKLGWTPSLHISRAGLREMFGYSLANYIAGFLWSAPLLIAPIMVVNHLGASPAAYFYMVMMIINMLLIIPTATTQSLFAEGSHADDDKLMHLVKKSVAAGVGLTLVGIAGILVFGKLAISSFGHEYANGGATLLYILALSCLLVVLNMAGNVVLKVRKHIWTLVAINTVGACSTIVLFPVLAKTGLNGIGYAYLIGQVLMTLCYGGIFAWNYFGRRVATNGRSYVKMLRIAR
jgi:O-antigen/teichoic acid export membrane protein